MTKPIFISVYEEALPNWREAFPVHSHYSALPSKFSLGNECTIFLDITALEEEQRSAWLSFLVASKNKVVVLSALPKESEAVWCIKLGAVGYGHAFAASDRLVEMEAVAKNGGLWLGPELIEKVMKALSLVGSANNQREVCLKACSKILTEREFTVASYLSLGASNAEISNALGVRERTVKAHVSSLLAKLRVKNRVELALLLNNVHPEKINFPCD